LRGSVIRRYMEDLDVDNYLYKRNLFEIFL